MGIQCIPPVVDAFDRLAGRPARLVRQNPTLQGKHWPIAQQLFRHGNLSPWNPFRVLIRLAAGLGEDHRPALNIYPL